MGIGKIRQMCLVTAALSLGFLPFVLEGGPPVRQVKPRISGIWNVHVEGLSIWAPHYTLHKSVGLVYWKIWLDDRGLSIDEYVPTNSEPTIFRDGDLRNAPFKRLKLADVSSDQRNVSFKVRGILGAFEQYKLEYFGEDEIRGRYLVYDRYGGGPGSGPEYSGTLILTKTE